MARKNSKKKFARMDLANRALCFQYRNPPKGQTKMPFTQIRKLVRKTDGSRPEIGSIAGAAASFLKKGKGAVGRPEGWRKTTKAEDKVILKTFHKLRPPGHGITSRRVQSALPKGVRKKICKRTIRNRLAQKGFIPRMKLHKQDFSVKWRKKRVQFGEKHLEWTASDWDSELQAVADASEYTWYPRDLRAKFYQLRANWTYMSEAERTKSEFQRPKKWFPKKEWQRVKKQKVFGMTTSSGKKLVFLVAQPWKTETWAKQIKDRVLPFLKKSFPRRSSFKILLDGERLLHGPAAKKAMKAGGISVFPGWPGYSPDLNPQEHVWGWAEDELRDQEEDKDTFEVFQKRVRSAVKAYPNDWAKKFVSGMAKRMQKVVDKKGANIGK